MWLLTLRDLQYRRVRVLVVVAPGERRDGPAVPDDRAGQPVPPRAVRRHRRDRRRALGARRGHERAVHVGGTLPADARRRARRPTPGRSSSPEARSRAIEPTRTSAEVVVVGGEPPSACSTTMAAPALVEGRPVGGPDEVVVDESAGFDVGDRVQLGPAARRGRRADVGHDGARRPAAGVHRDRHGPGPRVPEPRRRSPACSSTARPSDAGRARSCAPPTTVAEDALGPLDGRHRLGRPRPGAAVARHRGHHRRRRVPVARSSASATSPSCGRWGRAEAGAARAPSPCRPCSSRSLAAVVAIVLQRLLVPLFPLHGASCPAGALLADPARCGRRRARSPARSACARSRSADPAAAFAGPGA